VLPPGTPAPASSAPYRRPSTPDARQANQRHRTIRRHNQTSATRRSTPSRPSIWCPSGPARNAAAKRLSVNALLPAIRKRHGLA
jgi:hypothetical protein